jgi:glycosyltransferase-like protein
MKPLRIALFTYSTKPRGGVVHTLRLAEELTSLKHDVHVYTLSSGNGFYRNVDFPHTLIPCSVVNYPSIDEKIESYIRIYYEYLSSINELYDIYHAEDCISANALLELRNNGVIKSFVRTVHHLDDFTSNSLIECQSNSILEPDHVMVVSRYWEKELRSLYSLNPILTQNGVDVGRFSQLKGDEYSKESAKGKFSVYGCRVILSIGGIEPRKNTLTTLRAFNIAKSYFMKKGERLIWLIGGGETLFDYRAYREEFFSQVERLGLKMDQDIRVLGNIPEENMPDLYGAGDIFVFPSLKEGWGLVVLEAMASGVPVIASNIAPLTEYLKDSENAILIPPMDHEALAQQIISVLENRDLREKLATNGMRTAKAYSWRNTALMHSEFYNRILEGVIPVKKNTS